MPRCATTGSWFLAVWLACSGMGEAASRHTETFSGGVSGWTKSGSLQIAAEGGVLRGQFASQSFPFPESGSWLAGPAASGGAFSGDYEVAGIRLAGFSFMAQDVLPSAALLRGSGPTSSFFRSFAALIAQTGIWYRLAFSLGRKQAGGWISGGDLEFATALRDVHSLEIQLTRAGMGEQRFYLADVFLDDLPVACSQTARGGPVVWSHLRPSIAYRIEAANTPTSMWETIHSFQPATDEYSWTDPDATHLPRRVYRLLFHEHQP